MICFKKILNKAFLPLLCLSLAEQTLGAGGVLGYNIRTLDTVLKNIINAQTANWANPNMNYENFINSNQLENENSLSSCEVIDIIKTIECTVNSSLTTHIDLRGAEFTLTPYFFDEHGIKTQYDQINPSNKSKAAPELTPPAGYSCTFTAQKNIEYITVLGSATSLFERTSPGGPLSTWCTGKFEATPISENDNEEENQA